MANLTYTEWFTTPNTAYYRSLPMGVSRVTAVCFGGGGCGGGITSKSFMGGGGGGGGVGITENVTDVNPGQEYYFYVGAGGRNSTPLNGGDSSCILDGPAGSPVAVGLGGYGVAADTSTGGKGNTGQGDTTYNGGNGATAVMGPGGGGGGAGDANNGTNGTDGPPNNGGAGGANYGGDGGSGQVDASGDGGAPYGGGGGGAATSRNEQSGGNGGDGAIYFTYDYAYNTLHNVTCSM